MRRRWDSGEGIGPRVLMAGFIDGPGPYAGPTKVAGLHRGRRRWSGWTATPSSATCRSSSTARSTPSWCRRSSKRAHELGLRVSGHIPNGMSAEQAVRAGFDEIQHVNFLILNFLDPKIDTRTPARFPRWPSTRPSSTSQSDRVKSFIALLKERGTVSDPTLAAFEGMFKAQAGEIDPSLAAVADRLPPQVQRGLYGGGLNPPADQAQRYRDSLPGDAEHGEGPPRRRRHDRRRHRRPGRLHPPPRAGALRRLRHPGPRGAADRHPRRRRAS